MTLAAPDDIRWTNTITVKYLFILVRFIASAVLMFACSSVAFAQDDSSLGNKALSGKATDQNASKDVNASKEISRSSLAEAGTGASSTTAVKPEGADGAGTQSLGNERHPLYRLRPSDVVEISFTVAPEFNQSLTVQPDGYVMLKDAGMIQVEGLNLAEFTQTVQSAYRGYLHDPQVAVLLKDFEHPFFIVGGQVGHPGKFELRSDTTVAEAVQIAGGFTQLAKHSQVVLFRRVNDDLMEARLLNLKKMMKQPSLKEDAHLRPGDMIFVPQNEISKIAQFFTKPSASLYMSPTQF